LLTWFINANFTRDIDARKSTIVLIFFLVNNPVTRQSTKQRVVAQSSCESEFIAAVNTTCQPLWLARVLVEMHGSAPSTSLLRVDKSIIALTKNPVLHRQSKHIELKYHLV
jgi:hypothetical protein